MRMQDFLRLFLLSFLLLLGCSSGAKKGAWYQNIKTGEKIKIHDVGTGQEILDRLKKAGGGRYWHISGAGIYDKEKCFGYETEARDTPPVYHIEPLRLLEEDYLKLK